jgi:hypothetical protein
LSEAIKKEKEKEKSPRLAELASKKYLRKKKPAVGVSVGHIIKKDFDKKQNRINSVHIWSFQR